jgi:hypothetical protein
MGQVNDILDEVRSDIAANDKVLKEARKRRDLVAKKAAAFPGVLRQYSSGSVAHGTVNNPVNDADDGIVLDRRTYPDLGPEGDEKEGPNEIVEEIREFVSPKIRKVYPDAVVTTSKRGLLVRFSSPLHDQDPTVDIIVTLTRKDGSGLWIPNLETKSWDASHPEKHTELFIGGTESLRALRARVIRLVKALNKQWSEPALTSFNVEALAWESIDDSSLSLEDALTEFFTYAESEVRKRNTKDPAGVSANLKLLVTRKVTVKRLKAAAANLRCALAAQENEGDNDVQEAMAKVFRDYVDAPSGSKADWAALLRKGNEGVSATVGGLALSTGHSLKTTRAFGGQ